MNPIRRILLPVDFSECSAAAAAMTASLAGKLGAEVEVMTAVEAAALLMADGVVMPREAVAELCNTAEQRLREFRTKHLGRLPTVRQMVRDGAVVPEILAAARLSNADLIVVGTHGRTGWGRFLMGSVAEKLVRKSPVPVLTVRAAEGAADGAAVPAPAIRTILVPTDFSDCAAAAAAAAQSLARSLGAKIALTAVVDASTLREIYGDENYLNERISLVLARARENLDKFAKDNFERPGDVAREVREGKVAAEILAGAAAAGADLIVMGTHGRGGLPHMLLGSIAEKVLRKSPVPVLTVRPAQVSAAAK